MGARSVCVVTGSRAEYGLLSVVLRELAQDPAFCLQVIATGMHLCPEFGLTVRAIEADGFTVDRRVEMLLSSDTAVGVTKSLGLGVIGFADALADLRPDLLLLAGDRFEILAAAEAALIARVPVAHIAGGDTTEGAFDESIRHSITKMAHLHFVTNAPAQRRVRQLGEDPERIFIVGSPGIDVIKRVRLLGREQLARELGFAFLERNLLVTFHPATLDDPPATVQFGELLRALERLGDDVGVLFTQPNADTEGRAIGAMADAYAAGHPNARVFASLGHVRYLSAVSCVDAVVGNSSSGLYEVPSLKVPTVNIGDRQRGRLAADSVINCRPEAGEIEHAIAAAFAKDCSGTVSPYGDGTSAAKIVAALRSVSDFRALLKKRFFDLAP
jgi:UDP-N-acetylglucosamine 2-epimerase (non-hydrolysing)/GDP/UDP-N,N'-diacetylbacillosamine 2-epimerase (hydrolysing)